MTELTTSQICRVYAASGMSLAMSPETLRKIADALDAAEEHHRACGEMLKRCEAVSKRARRHAAASIAGMSVWAALIAARLFFL